MNNIFKLHKNKKALTEKLSNEKTDMFWHPVHEVWYYLHISEMYDYELRSVRPMLYCTLSPNIKLDSWLYSFAVSEVNFDEEVRKAVLYAKQKRFESIHAPFAKL